MRGPWAGVRGSAVDESGLGRLEGQGGGGGEVGYPQTRELEVEKWRLAAEREVENFGRSVPTIHC